MSSVRFQMYASALSSAPVIVFPTRKIFAYPIAWDAECNANEIPNFPTLQPLTADVTLISDGPPSAIAVVSFNNQTIASLDDIPIYGYGGRIGVGDCFKFVLVEYWHSAGTPNVPHQIQTIGCTNCFKRVDELCYKTLLSYINNENNFDFYYNNGTKLNNQNRVLLPFYLHSPQLLHEESSYQKSDGTYLKLFERIEEELLLQTDYMPQSWHRKLKVALAHDSVFMGNPNYDDLIPLGTNFICRDDYQIAWNENVKDLQLAQASTKVKVSAALSLLNSNCS